MTNYPIIYCTDCKIPKNVIKNDGNFVFYECFGCHRSFTKIPLARLDKIKPLIPDGAKPPPPPNQD